MRSIIATLTLFTIVCSGFAFAETDVEKVLPDAPASEMVLEHDDTTGPTPTIIEKIVARLTPPAWGNLSKFNFGKIQLVQHVRESVSSNLNNNDTVAPLPSLDLESNETGDANSKPVIVLTPEVQQLSKQIEMLLTSNAKRPLSLASNTPAELIAYSNVYGAEAKVFQSGVGQPQARNQQGGGQIFAIGSLCWNYPGAGKTLLRTDGTNVIAKVGSGLQRKQAAFLSMLAMSSIADNYEMRVADKSFKVADLVNTEKENCTQNSDLSLALVALSFYCGCEDEWTDAFGEKWSIPKMVYSELCRPADQGSCDMTDQLFGFACAIRRFENENVAISGPMQDAKKYLESYIDFALSASNEQGLWHPQFFLFRGTSSDTVGTMYSSGHIFRFLAFALPPEKLTDPRMVKAASALVALVNKASGVATTEQQNESIATALHGLAIYNERLAGN